MKKISLVLMDVMIVTCLYAQKPALDPSAYGVWPSAEGGAISNDGRYVQYNISSGLSFYKDFPRKVDESAIVSTDGSWKLELPGEGGGAMLTSDGRWAIFNNSKDSLGIIRLGRSSIDYIPHVSGFQLPKGGDGATLAYLLKEPAKELVLLNLETGSEKTYDNVTSYSFSDDGKRLVLQTEAKTANTQTQSIRLADPVNGNITTLWSATFPAQQGSRPENSAAQGITHYSFSDDGRALVLQTETKSENDIIQSVKWIELGDGKTTTLWEGNGAGNIISDEEGTQLAFEVDDKTNGGTEKSIWYYRMGAEKAVMLADNQSAGIGNDVRLGNISGFSKDGSQLFFELNRKAAPLPKPDPNAVQLNVWSYTDNILQPQQLNGLNNTSEGYKAVINIPDHQVIRLEQQYENNGYGIYPTNGAYYIICHMQFDGAASGELSWNSKARRTWYLVSTKNRERKRLKELEENWPIGLSPAGKYLIYYDRKQKNVFSYETATGVIRNITKGVTTTWYGIDRDDLPGEKNFPRQGGFAGWISGDQAMLLYDQHDIWEIDPSGKKPPVNLTNGYGSKHSIIFYLVNQDDDPSKRVFASNAKLILTAFNTVTKDNGFYSKALGEQGDPELLTMGPYVYDITDDGYASDAGTAPAKAKDADVYLVRRESATESPNYFSTTDFKTFTPLSSVHPEKNYNWYTTQLCTWKSLDGRTLQGILYKPEDFDPNKKYPVLFYYYERLSDGLNSYLQPEFLPHGCDMDIPTYVSNGYLVFCPDIYYPVGDPMQGTYNSIVSAVHYISKLPFVDAKKLGAQGCSFGGIQTDYVVTHTGLFTAACSASSVADWISNYGALDGEGGNSNQGMYEDGQNRMGASLWKIPGAYIKNSPIFKVNKVTTPFLMMETTKDTRCPFVNAVEFFTALRRLGKTAWMLEYEDGNHGIDGKSAEDFNVRMKQFFDYYLMDKPAPEWMIKGIPARLKGIETGLELEPQGVSPGPSLLMNEEVKTIK